MLALAYTFNSLSFTCEKDMGLLATQNILAAAAARCRSLGGQGGPVAGRPGGLDGGHRGQVTVSPQRGSAV